MKWIELAHDKNCYLYPTMLYWLTAQHAAQRMGVTNTIIGCWYGGGAFSYLTIPGGLTRTGAVILRRLQSSDALLHKIVSVNRTEIPRMLAAARKLSGNMRTVSNRELYRRWVRWLTRFTALMTHSALGTVIEMERPLLSNAIEAILRKRFPNDTESVGRYFQVLSSSPRLTVTAKEEIALLTLRLKDIAGTLRARDLIRHVRQFAWISYGYNGPSWTTEDIRQRLRSLPKTNVAVRRLIGKKRGAGRVLAQEQRRLEKKLRLTAAEQRLITALRTLAFWKFERKALNQKAHLLMEDFVVEVARRNNLSRPQALMLSPVDMEKALVGGGVDPDVLNERLRESMVIFRGTRYRVVSGATANSALHDLRRSLYVNPNQKEVSGSVAYPGYVRGVVRRVDTAAEMPKVRRGDILVSTSTNPQIVPAMKKAGAIVTDSGGITSHAAIVSRELGVPCVIGTKVATKVFKDGDRVEVDATKGIVRRIT